MLLDVNLFLKLIHGFLVSLVVEISHPPPLGALRDTAAATLGQDPRPDVLPIAVVEFSAFDHRRVQRFVSLFTRLYLSLVKFILLVGFVVGLR